MTLTQQYMALVQKVLTEGNTAFTRNGPVKKLWAPPPIVVPDVTADFPYLQNRPTPVYKAVLETMFFLSGASDYEAMPEVLANSWWKPWRAEAHDQKSWGRFYGTQWRAQVTETPGVYFDALQDLLLQLIEVVETKVENRKMVVSLWHTADAREEYTNKPAVLESCHSTSLCFDLEPSPEGWDLNLHHTQRSLDLVNGTAADLVYSGLLLHCLANYVSNATGVTVRAKALVFAPVNVHIYANHWNAIIKHLDELPEQEYKPARLEIKVFSPLGLVLTGQVPTTIEEAKSWFKIHVEAPKPTTHKFSLNA
jgi:thymidylate synthase